MTVGKRPRPPDGAEQEQAERPSKKPRKARHCPVRFPSSFYDCLPFIYLTHRALWEFNRRNDAAEANALHSRRETKLLRAVSKKPPVRPIRLIKPERYGRICAPSARKALLRYARHGGPDLRDVIPMAPGRSTRASRAARSSGSSRAPSSRIRKRSAPSRSSGQSSSYDDHSKTKSTGPYDANFATFLNRAGIYDGPRELKHGDTLATEPPNMQDIRQTLKKRRLSLRSASAAQSTFANFKDALADVKSETDVTHTLLCILGGDDHDKKTSGRQIRFTNLASMLHDASEASGRMTDGNPDVWDGLRRREVADQIQHDLKGLIIPTNRADFDVAPNFCVAVKGLDGSQQVAENQARYDGALSARGIHALQTYGTHEAPAQGSEAGADLATTISAILQVDVLRLFSIVRRYNPMEQRAQYYTHPIDVYGLSGTCDKFIEGATAFRNARDWAESVRLEAVQRATSQLQQQ